MSTKTPRPTATLVASWGPSLINFRQALITELVRRGYGVVAAAPEIDDRTRAALEQLGPVCRPLGLRRRTMFSMGDVRALATLRSLVRSRNEDDVIVPYTIKPILLTGIAHRISRRPAALVPMFTGLGVLTRTESSASGALLRRVLRWVLRDSRAVIVQHEGDRRWLRYYRIVADDAPIVIVPGSGVDTERFRFQPMPAEEPPEVLYLGRMVPEKGISAFCDLAAAANFSARWVAVGPFEDDVTRQELLSRFAHAGVEYRGATDDVRPHLAAARVVVLLTTYGEGIPRVIQEAMAVGRPVVASDAPGCRVAVVPGLTGTLVAPVETGRALDAIGALCHELALADQQGQSARRRTLDVFEAGKVAKLTADAVLSPHAGGHAKAAGILPASHPWNSAQ